ncbi:eukaryotic translation initiation factor 3 subunit a-like protein [Plakobranchus ocellatus]|uniref:Eukaryotic translation initiation factor 3 subunit a-like protein n=1 Tax=Plakobranchus ocellatus TaxID=259542 RepID=A0AAV4BHH2_9GAST|nr:eukaryotic translation initiation factor 3 subunit a-like protein [Plakobranchus ocellatus]
MSLGFSEIASDDSETLFEKCVSMFQDLCEVYTLGDEDVDGNELLKDVIRKMTCLLSDRAAVMKAFNVKMSSYKDDLLKGEDCSTLFLFCNAHFLLALSSAAENAVQIFEKEAVDQGGKLGRDSSSKFATFSAATENAAIRLIRLTAEVLGPRPDEKSGCRQEWLAFCSSRGCSQALLVLEIIDSIIFFKMQVLFCAIDMTSRNFLMIHVSHSNLKLQSVLADLDDDILIE